MKMYRKTCHRPVSAVRFRASVVAMLLSLSFMVSATFYGNDAPAQSKLALTRSSGAQAKSRPGDPALRSYEFDTVTVDAKGEITNRRKGQARFYVEDAKGVGLEMVEIPDGSFTMGSPDDIRPDNASPDSLLGRKEQPAHRVTVPAFYMAKYELTQEQWSAVAKLPMINRDMKSRMRPNDDYPPFPAMFKGDKLPVESADWNDAIEFCARLSKATGRTYRLPTEAEWEYACRAGTTTAFAFGETITPEIVNYDGNEPYGSAPKGIYRKRTLPVGSFGVANGFGLYDMHGNAAEWCLDTWHWDYNNAPTDGSAREGKAETPGGWVLRGGGWRWSADGCRSAYRNMTTTNWGGIRVVTAARTR
jgi:formylglycine-generating enzyme required for sulfatase activity